MRFSSRAYSLTELMVVVGIIAMFSVVSIPAYKGYKTRARMAEVINILGGYKTQIADYHTQTGAFPNNHEDLGYTDEDGYISGSDSLNPAISSMAIVNNDASPGGCEDIISETEVNLNADALGVPELVNNIFYMEIAEINGVLVSTCIPDDPEDAQMIELLENCYNPAYPTFDDFAIAVCAQ